MARGRLFSRKYEPAKPGSLETSSNPLVQLRRAFQKVQNLAPETQPRPTQDNVLPGRRPLVNINDVRKYMREKLAITREVSTIPIPYPSPNSSAHLPSSLDAYEFSEITYMSSKYAYSSDTSSLPQYDSATWASIFDIGTVGHPILEVRSQSSSSQSSSSQSSSEVSPPSTSILGS